MHVLVCENIYKNGNIFEIFIAKNGNNFHQRKWILLLYNLPFFRTRYIFIIYAYNHSNKKKKRNWNYLWIAIWFILIILLILLKEYRINLIFNTFLYHIMQEF